MGALSSSLRIFCLGGAPKASTSIKTSTNKPDMEAPFTVAIVGSGIGGLALAIGLEKQKIPYIVLESAPRFDAVGAGIGLGPNALRAMELMDPEFAAIFDAIKVKNKSPSRLHEQLEILSGEEGFGLLREPKWKGGHVGHEKFIRSSAHRKALLEIMQSLIPENSVRFNKRVVKISQGSGGRVKIAFEDGETIEADAVIVCDGIKGMSRKEVLGSRYPGEVAAKYAHAYIYRGICPMSDATKILGSYAEDARWFMSEGSGCAIYPISKGDELNIVAFRQDKGCWTGAQTTKEVTQTEMNEEFANFDHRLRELLEKHVKPTWWPLFHHPDTPTYYNGHICLLGDSAHASSPSQAAGAGLAFEDAFILSRILGQVTSSSQLEYAFQVFDASRRPRAQAIVQESLKAGEGYFLGTEELSDDLQKITDRANGRLPLIWYYDLEEAARESEASFRALVQANQMDEVSRNKNLEAKIVETRHLQV